MFIYEYRILKSMYLKYKINLKLLRKKIFDRDRILIIFCKKKLHSYTTFVVRHYLI